MTGSRTGDIRIDEDEYLSIIKGMIRAHLRRYLTSGDIAFPSGEGSLIAVTMDELDLPTWRFGFQENGIGQGDGELGDDMGPVQEPGEGEKGEGAGPGTPRKGKIVIDLSDEEFAEFLQEALELPNIIPKGDRSVIEEVEKYRTVSRIGPRSMLHLRRTLEQVVRRSIAAGSFQPPGKLDLHVEKQDLRFRASETVEEPKNNAVIFFARDVSGSMGPQERQIVTYMCSLCRFWLSRNYDRLENVFIIHDDRAERVEEYDFFHKDYGGGTVCSTALEMVHRIVEDEFPVSQWNIYVLYLSDGFNFTSDNEKFIDILANQMLPIVNQFNYAQIGYIRPWMASYQRKLSGGVGPFAEPGTLMEIIRKKLGGTKNLATASIEVGKQHTAIDAMREFFRRGN